MMLKTLTSMEPIPLSWPGGYSLKKQMLDNIQEHKIAHKVFAMNKPLLIFHATEDDTVLIEQAEKIFKAAKHPKEFHFVG
jgi:putative redox protein